MSVNFSGDFYGIQCRRVARYNSLAASLGVDRVKGHHLWAHFSEIKEEDMRRNGDAVRRWNDIVTKAHAAADCLLPTGKKVLLENINDLDMDYEKRVSGRCPFLGKEAWISAEGRFNLVVLRMNSGGHWVSLVICMNPT